MFVLMVCGLTLIAGVCVKVEGEPPGPAPRSDDKPPGAQPAKPAAAADPYAWETVDRKPGAKGPLDADAKERETAKGQFQAIIDNAPLTAVEMPAYWSLMRWSRDQTFAEMQQRARRGGVDVFFKDFAEKPEKHRGELVQLRLHVVRALTFESDKNSAGVKHIYEVWGVTDNDSRTNPYVVIFSEKPPELPLGADIDEEGTFVGYFLKDLGYEAYAVHRSAPLLIGRFRWIEIPVRTLLKPPGSDPKNAPPPEPKCRPLDEDLGFRIGPRHDARLAHAR